MSVRSANFVPALLRFPGEAAREDSWGRFVELAASTAILATQTPLQALDKVLLSFEVYGEKFKDLPAMVENSITDDDGFCRADLRFQDEVEKRRLARCLADLLSRHIDAPK
ncbi:MAG: hypothetical protein WC881_04670 [Elusimicrobiota bacterium]|jgi:hypothetical protein